MATSKKEKGIIMATSKKEKGIITATSKKEKDIILKKKTLKWLNHLSDEYLQNSLAYEISDENTKLNDKDVDEIEECIKWVKSK